MCPARGGGRSPEKTGSAGLLHLAPLSVVAGGGVLSVLWLSSARGKGNASLAIPRARCVGRRKGEGQEVVVVLEEAMNETGLKVL